MTSRVRIAHISDIHLSPQYYPERDYYFRTLLLKCKDLKVDHIIIIGDITNQAKKIEFDAFRQILKEFRLLNSNKLTVIVGNHDIFGGPYHAEEVLQFPSFCRETDYNKKITEFYDSAHETFQDVYSVLPNTIFPFLKVIGNVAIIGLNSVAPWDMLANPLGSNGAISDKQLSAVETLLKSKQVKGKQILIAIHHHFHKMKNENSKSKLERLWNAIEKSTMKLHKKKRLLKILKNARVAAVLHGHIHFTEEYKRYDVRCFNAAASMVPAKNEIPQFQIFDIGNESFEVHTIALTLRSPYSLGRILHRKPVLNLLAKA